jgi:hypothetical protein
MLLGLIVVAVTGITALGLIWRASFSIGQATGPAGKALAVAGGLVTSGLVAFALYVAAMLVVVATCGCLD